MQRRTAQATGVSVALHAALLGSVLLLKPRAADGPSRLTIIHAEILPDSGTSTARAAKADGPGRSVQAELDAPTPESTEPAEAAEPHAADAAVAQEPEPPADESDTLTDAERRASPSEPMPAETLADVPPGAPSADPAETEAIAAPPAAAPSAAVESEAEPAEAVAESSEDAPAPTIEAAASTLETLPETTSPEPGVPLESREREAIEKRFASWTGTFQPTESDPTVAWKQDGQAYTAVMRQLPSGDPMGIERVVVDVTTEQGGRRMSTQLTMTRLAFSNFAQFVDQWDPDVQIHDDEIDGRFHSNSEIKLLSSRGTSPVFRGKVTIASHGISTETTGRFVRREVFPEGVETGVRRITLPSRFLPFLNEAANGAEAVQRFERSARITFYPDGTYGWTYVDGGEPEQRLRLTAPAHYLIGLEDAELRLKGTVNGKVLVYTAERIVIEDDLRYAHGRDRHGDDYLGLVAERSVEIAGPDLTGPGDLEVDASIYARRRFAVRDFYAREGGTLVIFGSLTAGSVTATEPRYATKVEFDRRLENARPPSFPLTDRYELESWDGQWREASALD
jgi:hypothetical protein